MIEISAPPWETEFHRRNAIVYAFDAILSQGVVSAGASRTLTTPLLALDTGVGANRESESAEFLQTQWEGPAGHMFSWPILASVIVIPLNTATPVDNNSQIGLEICSPNAFADPAAPAFGLIKLFWRTAAGVWTLRTARGDATAFLDTDLAGVDLVQNPPDGTPFRIAIAYSPAQYVSAIVNGKVGATVTNTAKIPTAASNPNASIGAGVYVKSSNNALDQTTAYFHELVLERIGKV